MHRSVENKARELRHGKALGRRFADKSSYLAKLEAPNWREKPYNGSGRGLRKSRCIGAAPAMLSTATATVDEDGLRLGMGTKVFTVQIMAMEPLRSALVYRLGLASVVFRAALSSRASGLAQPFHRSAASRWWADPNTTNPTRPPTGFGAQSFCSEAFMAFNARPLLLAGSLAECARAEMCRLVSVELERAAIYSVDSLNATD